MIVFDQSKFVSVVDMAQTDSDRRFGFRRHGDEFMFPIKPFSLQTVGSQIDQDKFVGCWGPSETVRAGIRTTETEELEIGSRSRRLISTDSHRTEWGMTHESIANASNT